MGDPINPHQRQMALMLLALMERDVVAYHRDPHAALDLALRKVQSDIVRDLLVAAAVIREKIPPKAASLEIKAPSPEELEKALEPPPPKGLRLVKSPGEGT